MKTYTWLHCEGKQVGLNGQAGGWCLKLKNLLALEREVIKPRSVSITRQTSLFLFIYISLCIWWLKNKNNHLQLFSLKSFTFWIRKMAPCIKVLAAEPHGPKCDPWDPHSKREPTAESLPLIFMCVCVCTQRNKWNTIFFKLFCDRVFVAIAGLELAT